MNIYLVQGADLNAVGYDEWDSIVVIAESQEAAFEIHPSFWVGERYYPNPGWGSGRDEPPLRVCHLLGTAKEGSVAGLVLASFNAG